MIEHKLEEVAAVESEEQAVKTLAQDQQVSEVTEDDKEIVEEASKKHPEIKEELKEFYDDEIEKIKASKPPPVATFYQREKVSRKQVWNFMSPFIFHKESMKKFWLGMTMLVLAKGLTVSSPFILKWIVNGMTNLVPQPGASFAVALKSFSVTKIMAGVGIWGLTRVISNTLLCFQMDYITGMIQEGIRRISSASFKHLHKLDLNYHRASSKNTVFGINRALRSIDGGLRFFLGFFSQMALEFLLLCGTLQLFCGPKYFVNMLITFGIYTIFTLKYSKKRIQQIKDKMNIDKRQEFY